MGRHGSSTVGAALLLGGFLIASPMGSAAAATRDMCVAANGDVVAQSGDASCAAEGQASIAIVLGTNSTATATGDDNRAMVRGDGSGAYAMGGDGNTATVTGDGSVAFAASGDGNTATVNGDDSGALAGGGDGNTATVTGDDCDAFAVGDGVSVSADCP